MSGKARPGVVSERSSPLRSASPKSAAGAAGAAGTAGAAGAACKRWKLWNKRARRHAQKPWLALQVAGRAGAAGERVARSRLHRCLGFAPTAACAQAHTQLPRLHSAHAGKAGLRRCARGRLHALYVPWNPRIASCTRCSPRSTAAKPCSAGGRRGGGGSTEGLAWLVARAGSSRRQQGSGRNSTYLRAGNRSNHFLHQHPPACRQTAHQLLRQWDEEWMRKH